MSSFSEKISEYSSNKKITNSFYGLILTFFILLVLFPAVFVILELLRNFVPTIEYVFTDETKVKDLQEGLFYSISVSIIISIFDLIFGIPLAWLLVRGKLGERSKQILNTLVELPLAVPTAGLGLSVALFWGRNTVLQPPPFSLGIIQSTIPILVLFHFTTTFPYVVRSLAAILEEIDVYLEIAARTCGASSFTAARTITLPLFRSGVSTALILSLAKSLSDTGGTVALLSAVNNASYTGTRLIRDWKHLSELDPAYISALALLSTLMIIIALTLMSLSRYITKKIKFPVKKVWPTIEPKLSTKNVRNVRNIITVGFLVFFVLIPAFFIFLYIPFGFTTDINIDWGQFLLSIVNSLIVASVATGINLIIGVPIGIFIARKEGRIPSFLNVLVDIPYIVPSSALGYSVGLFWGYFSEIISFQLIFVVMAHVSMTAPFIIRNVIGGLQDLDLSYEETARTLGAKPFQIFSLITLPIVKFSIIAGAIMSFTRSIGETGATESVSTGFVTAPIFIVDLIDVQKEYFAAALSIVILIVITSLVIFTIRNAFGKKRVRS